MLNIIRCPRPEEKRAHFTKFDPRLETWVVSDLQSKWHLQKVLLAKHRVLEETAVMRATELWRHFAFQLEPDLRILSVELAQTLSWNWIEPMNLPWARSPQAVQVVLNQMQMWMSIFSDPQHPEIMSEWFRDNPEAYVRWGHWFELCADIWRRCVERNLVMVSWLPAVILNRDLSELRWENPLMFDLGPQISQVEGLLVRELGKLFSVSVIYPDAAWAGLMKNALRPYAGILAEGSRVDSAWEPSVDQRLEFGRFSTQLAEVKDTVARVRDWLDKGVAAQKIAIVAPDIEHYWPVLRMYLEQEGIAVAKPNAARIGSFIEMAQWIAALRTALNKISAEDLEVYFFTQQDQPRLSFDEFRVLFSHVYDALDLNRARRLFEATAAPLPNEPVKLQEFLAWSMKFWNAGAETTRFVHLLQVLGQEVPRELTLLPRQWLSYFEGLLARREMNLSAAEENGIWCVSLSSTDWLDLSHGVFLNLCEGSLRRIENSQVGVGEAQKIFTDTGFALGATDRQELEFEFLWFLSRTWSEVQLNFAGTDFQGGVLTPSRLWMWVGFANEKLKKDPESPRTTRWDEIQRQPVDKLSALRGLTTAHTVGLELGLARDSSTVVNTWKADPEVRISASSLERFWMCPFMFAAQRKLKLADDPALDLDLDRRTRGNLLHAIVEQLMTEPLRWEWSDQELHALVDAVRERQKINVGDERLWPAIRSQHVSLGRMFLVFERSWRERFPATKTVGRETDFKSYWDMEQGAPSSTLSPITLSGRLDRIDVDSQGRYALIDYKASANQLTNWKTWLAKNDIQLALYSLLLELGMVGLASGPVVAANYYVVKDSDRRKGFYLLDPESELYSSEDGHRNFISEAEKADLFVKIREQIQSALVKITAGELNPNPEDKKICSDCAWRTLCRAPHLN